MSKAKKKDSVDFEIKFYEGVMKKRPEFIDAMAALAEAYTKKGKHAQALRLDEALVLLRPEDPIVHYNLACSYSLVNDVDKALAVIKQAVKYGYKDFEHLKNDDDLNNLRQDKRFLKFFERIRKQRDGNSRREPR